MTVYGMVHLRWRTAQIMRAMVNSDGKQARALRAAMQIEGISNSDMCDEFRLLLSQFGNRPVVMLSDEINRLWHQLTERCVKCGQKESHKNTHGVCFRCIIEEPS